MLNLDAQDIAAVMGTCAIMEENVWKSIMATSVTVPTQPMKDLSARKVGSKLGSQDFSGLCNNSELQLHFSPASFVSPTSQDVLLSAVPSVFLNVYFKEALTPPFLDFSVGLRN